MEAFTAILPMPSIATTEEDILRAVRAGERERFAELYDSYADRIYAFVYARVTHRETAEDLTSTVFMKALDRLVSFKGGSFSAWIYRIARNTVIDHYRTNKPTADLDAIAEPPASTNLEAETHNRDLLARVEARLKLLKPEHQEIVKLRVWDDLPYATIASIVGKSEAAVKMTFARAVAGLQTGLTAITILLTSLLSYGQ